MAHQKISLYHSMYEIDIDNNNKISIFGAFLKYFPRIMRKLIDRKPHISVGICVLVIILRERLYRVNM